VGNTTKRLTNKTIFAQIQFSFYFVALTFETFERGVLVAAFVARSKLGKRFAEVFFLSNLPT
jgi:hypothetical protein